MKAVWNDEVIAESDATIVIEGNHYFPADAVKRDYLSESEYHTTCPWKGEASYYHITVNGETNENAGWYYPNPDGSAIERVGSDFTNYIAFWNGVVVE